jgi:hypothetical protein
MGKIALGMGYLGTRMVVEGIGVKDVHEKFGDVGEISYQKLIRSIRDGLNVRSDDRDMGLRFEYVMRRLGMTDFDYRKMWESDWHYQVDGYKGLLGLLGMSHGDLFEKIRDVSNEYYRLSEMGQLPDDDYWSNIRGLSRSLIEYGEELHFLKGHSKVERGLIRIKRSGYVYDVSIAYRLGRLSEWLGKKVDWRCLLAKAGRGEYKRLLV